MTNKDMFDETFPDGVQVGGSHYKQFLFNLGHLLEQMVLILFKQT